MDNILLLTLCKGLSEFFKFYFIAISFRIYISWFPNINIYSQPFIILSRMTDPYLRLFRGIIPPLFGFDISPLLGFMLMTGLIDITSSVTSGGTLPTP